MTTLRDVLAMLLPLLFGITFHELAHGYVACAFGDHTPAARLARGMNPLMHLSFVGTVLMPVVTYCTTGLVLGWAKPVPVNLLALTPAQRAAVALAGPVANVAMLDLWLVTDLVLPQLHAMAAWGIAINLALALFNLLPIPPLDGAHVVASYLAWRRARHKRPA